MSAVLRKYTNFDDIKPDEYRYWQSRPVHERMDAVEEMILAAYALKGWEIAPDVPRLQRPLSAFHAHGVRYLVVGAYAVIYRAQPRASEQGQLL